MASAEAELEATVAVAVSGSRSRRAVRWAAQNLIPHASRVLLLHVVPPLSSIPNPSGQHTPIQQVGSDVVEVYKEDRMLQIKETLLLFKRLCQTRREVEMVVLEGEDPAAELLKYSSGPGAKNLVLGCSTFSWLKRILKGPDVPTTVLKSAPDTCNIFLVSRHKLILKLARQSISSGLESTPQIRKIRQKILTQRERSRIFDEQISRRSSMSSGSSNRTLEMSLRSNHSHTDSQASQNSDISSIACQKFEVSFRMPSIGEEKLEQNHHDVVISFPETQRSRAQSLEYLEVSPSDVTQPTTQCDDLVELEKLKIEVQNTFAKYTHACKDLVYARKKVQLLSAEFSEEARKVRGALEREEVLRQMAAEEKTKHLEAVKEIEAATQLLAKAALERHKAEINARKENFEKIKIVDALFSSDRRCKRYTTDEIKAATENFSDAKKIGEGGYGNVYRCKLDHTPVAIKVLKQDTVEKEEQFLREVEVLTQLNHPHMVLLLGVCPENRCLVYEYMENGSLEDRLFCKDGTQPLPWATRFRIIFEMACGLAFLHGSRAEPIVHCDLKPGNILLDRNYVSKIGDVGLARLMSDVVPDSITEYRDETHIAGTLHYMDPEYQRTGTLRPKSDLYAFGIIVLQMLTARHPLGLLVAVEDAIDTDSFADILDSSVKGWPLVESEKLAKMALKCSSLRCRDRPDLESEVIPELEQIRVSNARFELDQSHASAPTHYFCPILQEVMSDPYIAADGFTYEHRAIKAWLARHNVSPVTKLKLQHTCIIPNHTMRSAIQEWKSHMELSTA